MWGSLEVSRAGLAYCHSQVQPSSFYLTLPFLVGRLMVQNGCLNFVHHACIPAAKEEEERTSSVLGSLLGTFAPPKCASVSPSGTYATSDYKRGWEM